VLKAFVKVKELVFSTHHTSSHPDAWRKIIINDISIENWINGNTVAIFVTTMSM
jgi:hypothetical protein